VASILERVLRVGEGRTLRRLENYAEAINALEDDFQALSDEELKHETV
jgi:preprotein translocase subunit SecA